MAKWIAAVIVAFALGAATAYAWRHFAPSGAALVAAHQPSAARHAAGQTAAAADEQPPERATTLAEIAALASDFEQTATLYALLRKADASTVERLLREAEGLRPRRERVAAKSIIYARYAELDPLAAVESALAQETDKREMLDRVFTAWAKHDFEAALAHARTIQGALRQPAASAVLAVSEALDPARRQALAEAFSLQDALAMMDTMEQLDGDPALAWRHALATESVEARAQQLFQVGTAWVQRDPEQALAAAMELPAGGILGAVVPFLVERWAEQDADGALAWILAQPKSRARGEMLGAVARIVAQGAPQDALALAATLDGVDRRHMAQAALQAWAQTDAPAAMRALEEAADLGVPSEVRFSLLAQWSDTDPHAAFEWAVAQKSSMENTHLVVLPLQQIAARDPQEALRLAEKLSGMQRRGALASVVSTWADSDPRAAAAWLESATGDVSQAVSAVAFAFAQRAPAEAFDWVSTLPKRSQQIALQSLVSAAAMNAPDQAVGLVANIRDAELRAEATRTLVMGWGQNAPRDAAQWVARNADAQERPALYRQLFQSWGFHDRDGAEAELRRLRRGDERDWAALGLVTATAFDDVEFAERVYDRIQGDDHKRDAAQAVYHALLQADPDRAERFRKKAGIEGVGGDVAPGGPVFFFQARP